MFFHVESPPPPFNVCIKKTGRKQNENLNACSEWFLGTSSETKPAYIMEIPSGTSSETPRAHPSTFDFMFFNPSDTFSCALCKRTALSRSEVRFQKVNLFSVNPHASFCERCITECNDLSVWKHRGGNDIEYS